MFKIIQSHRTENLVNHLLEQYKTEQQHIFEPFVVIVPSMVLGDWLDKTIASRAGISTLVMTKFWGQYQWTLIQEVLACHNDYLLAQNPNATTLNVPEVAVLSTTVMQWRLFGYLTLYKDTILKDDKHALYPLLTALIDDHNVNNSDQVQSQSKAQTKAQMKAQTDARLWQLANDFARVFNRYLTHREDWLAKWGASEKLDVEKMIAEKDELSRHFDKYARGTPTFLIEHYIELERAQRYLWTHLFADVHQYRVALDKQFWQVLKDNKAGEQDVLPKVLRIFTLQQLPQMELNFLQRLSQYIDITLLHYNPSKLFWADIVDKSWLQRQQIINPSSVFLRDYGHSLLSRLGKQSRDMFAMLANLSGNEDNDLLQVEWQDEFEMQDDFVIQEKLGAQDNFKTQNNFNKESFDKENLETEPPLIDSTSQQHSATGAVQAPSLLHRLQNDVLMLDEKATQEATIATVVQAVSQEIGETEKTKQYDLFDSAESDAIVDTVEGSKHGFSGLNSDEHSLNQNSFDKQSSDKQSSEVNNAWYDDDVLANKRFEKEREWALTTQDNSLSIHACYSLQRQLEVLRIMIGRWLSDGSATERRHISDIVVLLPDVERHHALINAIFVNGKGQDGLTLPAKVTGVVDTSIRQLWEAIIGFYRLLGSDSARFEASEVLDWLMLPPLYESFGLTHEQMSRGCELLVEAGFIRGFDEAHLKQTLDTEDYDYRFSFAHALDKLTLGLIMPEAVASDCLYPIAQEDWSVGAMPERSLPLPQVSLNDAHLIETLCRIFVGLAEHREDHRHAKTAEEWLTQIESEVIHRYFGVVDQTRSMRAIYNAMNGFKSSLRANRHYKQYANKQNGNRQNSNRQNSSNTANTLQDKTAIEQTLSNVEALTFRLSFMLDSIEAELESQQVSAEPTGVITFGRFGALRNVPFKLVVMLNMNLSEFPAHDRDNRYDLMKASVSRRGDRVTEDDDNGAFLDALLCARSACWIFYNGKSLTDDHEHLPANPVSELLQFLQGEVNWQVDSLGSLHDNESLSEVDRTAVSLKTYLPQLVKDWLVTGHPALPFDKSLFEISTDSSLDNKPSDALDSVLNDAMSKAKLAQKKQFPPAPLWQAVFHTLRHRTANQQRQLVNLPTPERYKVIAELFGSKLGQLGQMDTRALVILNEMLGSEDSANNDVRDDETLTQPLLIRSLFIQSLFDIDEIDVEGLLAYQVRHPAKAFLRHQEIHIVQGEEALSPQEPLFLDNLTAYQIKDYLINELSIETTDNSTDNQSNPNQGLLYQQIMPAGVARHTTLTNQKQKLEQQCQAFKDQLLSNGIDCLNVSAVNKKTVSSNLNLLTPTTEHTMQIKDLASVLNIGNNDLDDEKNVDHKKNLDKKEFANNNGIHNNNLLLQRLPNVIKIKGLVPSVSILASSASSTSDSNIEQPKQWLNLLPNSASPRHLLKFWLSHLYWQVARQTTKEQVALSDGMSIWRFNKTNSTVESFKNTTTFKLPPIRYEEALTELVKWAIFAKLAGQVPMTLLPEYALAFVDNALKAEEKAEKPYYPKRADFSDWLRPSYHSDTIYDTCSQHAIWQYVLRDSNAFNALSDSLVTLARPLYEPMFTALEGVKD